MSVSKVTSVLFEFMFGDQLFFDMDEKPVAFNALFNTTYNKASWLQQTCVMYFGIKMNLGCCALKWSLVWLFWL